MSAFLQTSSGDLDISTGNLVVERNPDICSAQKLTNRFQLFLGEWFIDTRIGIPYMQLVFVKNPDLNAISQLFKRVILQTPNIADVLSANIDFYSSLRELRAQFKIQTETGAIIEGGPGTPFIVSVNGKGTN